MRLFELQDEIPVASAEARTLKEFRAILDRHKEKKDGVKELAFIHYYISHDSRFETYPTDEERMEAIISAVGLKEAWKPDELTKRAMVRYNDMLITASSELVKEAKSAVSALKEFLRGSQGLLYERTKSGGLVLKPVDLQNALIKLPEVIDKVDEAQKKVAKELQNKTGASSKKARSLMEDTPINITGMKI